MSHLKPADHALVAIKAALNAVPVVGGAIASLIGDYVPLSTQRSVERATTLLEARLSALEGRLDPEGVNKDEFAELFKSCYLVIVRTTQEDKLRAAVAILANLLLKAQDSEKATYTELDHLVRCLDSLSSGAIAALGLAYELAHTEGERVDGDGNRTIAFERLQAQYGEIGSDLLMGLVGELNGFNLLRIEGRPQIVTSHFGNYPLSLTPLGSQFVERYLERAP